MGNLTRRQRIALRNLAQAAMEVRLADAQAAREMGLDRYHCSQGVVFYATPRARRGLPKPNRAAPVQIENQKSKIQNA